jgi:hypothetical protein
MKIPKNLPALHRLALAVLLAVSFAGNAAAETPATLSLAGPWRFQLDRADAGAGQRWFERALPGQIHLPGALQNQGFGDDITVDTKWTGDVGSDRWKRRPEYAQYRQPGNIKVPFFLQPQKHYVGAAWYQRDFEVPEAWAGQRVALTLERPHWGTQVWLDGRPLGTNLSLSTPHVYELGMGLQPGQHTLTLRVDNRVLVEVGDWSHSVSDHTQGNWNGVIGRIELDATPALWLEDLQVHPQWATKSVLVKGRIGHAAGQALGGTVELAVKPFSGGSEARQSAKPGPDGTFAATLALGPDAAAWDEFNPALYELTATLQTGGASGPAQHARFGLRDITARGRQFVLNGHPAFFRGTLECCIFPKTGYPPTEVEPWKRLLRACKAHGLNLIRFHSWCPPEAAFTAADELGFYYQVECGVWTEPGSGKAIDQWLYDESRRIVRAYANHPSFVLLTHGNEPHGPKHAEYLAQWVEFWKRDGRFLVTSGSAYPQLPENQYHVFYPSRGPHGWLGKDYRQDVAKLEVPVIVHEMGQWCVYPNFDEVRKYTGPLQPKNFDIFRDSLTEHGMLDQRQAFLRASGKLQTLCYKEEIEAALRTPGISGFELLDLHDFPGQGTALVGVLDPFWESKGYVTPEEYSRFCGPVVPLARLLKRTWTTDETLTCEVELANYRPAPLEHTVTRWKLAGEHGTVAARGDFPEQTAPVGHNIALGNLHVCLTNLSAPAAYRLAVEVTAAGKPVAANDWGVWVYPAKSPGAPPADVWVTSALDEIALARLESGGKVLLFATQLSSEHPRLTFEPIFWNRYMFNTQNRQTLGLLCDARHPALAQFPTEDFQDWQWRDIVTSARAMVLADLPRGLRPMVQPIDDWNTNRRLGLIFECLVGKGRLLVCSADLEKNLDQRPAARQLRDSLLVYAASERFAPKVAVSKDDLAKMLARTKPSKLARLGAKVLSADSEDTANGNVAANALDGDAETIWHTRWQPRNDPMPHQLVIDLGREVALKGVTYLPRQDMANGRIAEAEIFCSNDPKTWGNATATAKWANSEQLQSVQFKQPVRARYLKFVAKAEVNRNAFAAVAELDVLTDDK